MKTEEFDEDIFIYQLNDGEVASFVNIFKGKGTSVENVVSIYDKMISPV